MSRDTYKLESTLLGRRPTKKPTPGGATFTEGVVERVGSDGMYFKLPSWDRGKHIFGPCPWPMSRVEPATLDITLGSGKDPDHPAHGHGTHHHVLSGNNTSDESVPTTGLAHDGHTHPGTVDPEIHDHTETVPVKGDRCLVLFPTADNDGVAQPWVIGWWPSGE
jgi:hypothetical protein